MASYRRIAVQPVSYRRKYRYAQVYVEHQSDLDPSTLHSFTMVLCERRFFCHTHSMFCPILCAQRCPRRLSSAQLRAWILCSNPRSWRINRRLRLWPITRSLLVSSYQVFAAVSRCFPRFTMFKAPGVDTRSNSHCLLHNCPKIGSFVRCLSISSFSVFQNQDSGTNMGFLGDSPSSWHPPQPSACGCAPLAPLTVPEASLGEMIKKLSRDVAKAVACEKCQSSLSTVARHYCCMYPRMSRALGKMLCICSTGNPAWFLALVRVSVCYLVLLFSCVIWFCVRVLLVSVRVLCRVRVLFVFVSLTSPRFVYFCHFMPLVYSVCVTSGVHVPLGHLVLCACATWFWFAFALRS